MSATRRRQMVRHDFRDMIRITRLAENHVRVRESGRGFDAGDDNDRDIGGQRVGRKLAEDRPPVDHWQIQVQHDQ